MKIKWSEIDRNTIKSYNENKNISTSKGQKRIYFVFSSFNFISQASYSPSSTVEVTRKCKFELEKSHGN